MSETQKRPGSRQEFTISLRGAELPQEVVDRIHRALHRTLLAEIADIDLASRHALRLLRLDESLKDNGSTQGIQAEIAEL
jgi:hypothetical protein